MNRLLARGLAIAVIASFPALALGADAVPDIKGKWVGKTFTIVAGKGGHWPKNKGTFAKPGLYEKDIVWAITGQEGRRFWGTTTISTGTGEATSEPFIGELTGKDNRTIVMADTDGLFNGELTGDDSLSACYAQAGGPTKSSVVSCMDFKRAR